ncbi:thioesterase superfamily protein [Haladaptatus paucihalophilus DX253]|uniref:Acyl-CoA hydrolase n=1 Tax=Haladaptatus paucihalophilus DX253 TaxID=797209 RepID=E7QPN8_HALPU|nr:MULTISPECIES: acyl-CoA thioesterase [Haladaptatus]EFW93454.1 thioesterase superfamily protein [Haladaptatus paucihalophilus DX253]GKZ15861.1 acyl-CoA thioesterase [Haladaptatus sp. T7]SHL19629.1 Acyl-CoA hydrolase [Haladaptatus paucihalophilus DX253]
MHDTATLAESRTVMSEILMPNDANNLGRALGGSILHWMDICAAISSRRFSRRQVVTASMDHVDFLGPIDLGDIVTVEGYVFETGETSMEVVVSVRAERPSHDEKGETATSFFTMVALDDDETPTAVPALDCPTDDQKTLRDDALRRREKRRTSLSASR